MDGNGNGNGNSNGTGNGNGRYGVPVGGLPAWAQPDDTMSPVAHIDGGLEVDLVERNGYLGRVVCSNGWAGWVDARLLVNGAALVPAVASADMSTLTAPAVGLPAAPAYAPSASSPPPPPPVAQDDRKRKPPWASGRGRLIIALVLVAAVVAAALLVGQGSKASAGEILLSPADRPGARTFAPSFATLVPASDGPNATTAPAPSSSGLVRANAAAPGLYSGVRGAANCDGNKLSAYLASNPTRAKPWAQAQGIQQDQIKPFIAALTPAALRVDTRVTDYQFSGGRAVAKPSILQAGTAVLLDREAMPRVRCQSGDPLGPARAVSDTPTYNGPRWPRFAPGTVVVLDPAPGTSIIVLIDPRTGLPFARVLGSVIVIDFDRPALGANVIVVEPGGPFTVAGTRFPPGAAITVTWDNPAVTLATPTADGAGNFAISVNAPATAAVGPHQVNITGGGLSVIQTVYVIPPAPR